ncbi:hypothetical protein [Erwinia sp. S59]|uniref:helix-turn-helix transcriptional regulator n=1 Tax=Erwinia sp. S59 TaxID=2769340 RepID=UPI00190982CA|nr:hypothetical protein [Erwinia sp. S59]MBK0092798.1 hypothetical protein [Erwinia sp. S59]
MTGKRLINTNEAVERLEITRGAFARLLRDDPDFPTPVILSANKKARNVPHYFVKEEIDAWMEKRLEARLQ